MADADPGGHARDRGQVRLEFHDCGDGQAVRVLIEPPDSVPVLSERHLNRAVLARQLLLTRERLPVDRALDATAGLQAQYAPTMYIGLWSRLEGFSRDLLTSALEDRTVVQGTLMRSTIHLVSAGDYWPLAVGVRAARQEWWLRLHRRDLTGAAMVEAAAVVRDLLRDGPIKRAQLDEALGGRPLTEGIGLWVDMVRVPPAGTWEHRRTDGTRRPETGWGHRRPA